MFVFLVFNAFEKVADEAVSAEISEKELIVVIDAGHGGEDSGAVANSVLEKDINLEIALKLRDMLKASGIEVKMIRESDVSIYDTASSERTCPKLPPAAAALSGREDCNRPALCMSARSFSKLLSLLFSALL